MLRWALANPALVLLATGTCLWLTWAAARQLDSELLPEVHQGVFSVELSLPVGTPVDQTDEILAPVERVDLVAYGRLVQRCDEIFWSDVEVTSAEDRRVFARGTVIYRIVT